MLQQPSYQEKHFWKQTRVMIVNQNILFFLAISQLNYEHSLSVHIVVLSMLKFLFIFVIIGVLLMRICGGFLSFIYICIAVVDPIIKRGGVWNLINRFNPTTFIRRSQAMT